MNKKKQLCGEGKLWKPWKNFMAKGALELWICCFIWEIAI